mmetsp:Transcript_18364/g.49374  ORF Transcript_18364/g.49374 Transcript_18364/m.49374 type:complete len:207 (-) Transcript_18364:109-729(-)
MLGASSHTEFPCNGRSGHCCGEPWLISSNPGPIGCRADNGGDLRCRGFGELSTMASGGRISPSESPRSTGTSTPSFDFSGISGTEFLLDGNMSSRRASSTSMETEPLLDDLTSDAQSSLRLESFGEGLTNGRRRLGDSRGVPRGGPAGALVDPFPSPVLAPLSLLPGDLAFTSLSPLLRGFGFSTGSFGQGTAFAFAFLTLIALCL